MRSRAHPASVTEIREGGFHTWICSTPAIQIVSLVDIQAGSPQMWLIRRKVEGHLNLLGALGIGTDKIVVPLLRLDVVLPLHVP